MLTAEMDGDPIWFVLQPDELTRIPPKHLTPATTDRSLVVEVRPPMVEGRLGGDGHPGARTGRQSPGPQYFTSLQHEVPMLRWMVVLQNDEAGHNHCNSLMKMFRNWTRLGGPVHLPDVAL
jgi:hypothetical protein